MPRQLKVFKSLIITVPLLNSFFPICDIECSPVLVVENKIDRLSFVWK